MRSGAMAAESYGEVRSEARLCWRVAHGTSLTAPHWTTSTSARLHLPLPPLSGSTTSPPKPSPIWSFLISEGHCKDGLVSLPTALSFLSRISEGMSAAAGIVFWLLLRF